jgi:hypothetical protein
VKSKYSGSSCKLEPAETGYGHPPILRAILLLNQWSYEVQNIQVQVTNLNPPEGRVSPEYAFRLSYQTYDA